MWSAVAVKVIVGTVIVPCISPIALMRATAAASALTRGAAGFSALK